MQRPEKSCSQCRTRKTRCDLALPRCSHCASRNLVCEFRKRQKPGPSKGFKKRQWRAAAVCPNTPAIEHSTPFREQAPETSSNQDSSQQSDSVATSVSSLETPPRWQDMLPDCASSLQCQLLDAYSSLRLFPYLPPFRTTEPFAEGLGTGLRDALINAICAIAVRFSRDPLLGSIATDPIEASDNFASQAKAFFVHYTQEQDFRASLEIVKLAVLLSVYDLCCSAGLKGWHRVGEAVRLAYDIELDQVDDCKRNLSPEEAEDRRYVWWCVYALDTYSSATLLRPFAIADDTVNTMSVSTSETQFKSGQAPSTSGFKVPSDPVELQIAVQSLDYTDPISLQTLFLYVLSLIRHSVKVRRSQLAGTDVQLQCDILQNVLAAFWFSLPDDVLGSSSEASVGVKLMRTEIMILMHLTSLSLYSNCPSDDRYRMVDHSYLATTEGGHSGPTAAHNTSFTSSWDKCVFAARSIFDLIRNLPPQELSHISPCIIIALWLPSVVMVLKLKLANNAMEISYFTSSIETMKSALERLGTLWSIARRIRGALDILYSNMATVRNDADLHCILRSYSSAFLSLSHKQLDVHIPSLSPPGSGQTTDTIAWPHFNSVLYDWDIHF